MKKLLYTLFLFTVMFLGSCELSDFSTISNSAKLVSNCCNDISTAACKAKSSIAGSNATITEEINQNSMASIHPAYIWDAKMMLR